MAIRDRLTTFCSAESVVGAAGTALIGDVVDMSEVRDIGMSNPLYLVISVPTGIITAGAAGTIQFFLVSDAQAAIATGGTATTHITSKAWVTDGDDANDLDAGAYALVAPLPRDVAGNTYERYLGILATIATTAVTQGTIDAYLTFDPPGGWKALADATN